MNNSNYQSLDISEQEIEVVRRYISNAHISMNALLDIDPEVINEQQSKGWVIDFSKRGIENNIEYLTKLYSAMYKYSLQNLNNNHKVYRGTTRREVNKLKKEGISGRFLSTSTDKNTAMSFTEYNNGALLDMYLDGVPYISTDDFLDENQFSESEILVSPFSIIEEIKEDSWRSTEAVATYRAGVKKKEFENITKEQKDECNQNIYSFDFENNLARYSELSFKVELMEQKVKAFGEAKTKEERDELAYMMQSKDELSKELYELAKGFQTVKQSLAIILQDRFKTVELEIELALEQEKKVKENETIKTKIESERVRKQVIANRTNETYERVSNISDYYKTMDEEDKQLYGIAQELGIDTSKTQNIDPEILYKFDELKRIIEELKKEIAGVEISDDLTKEELDIKGELNQKLNKLYDKIEIISHIMDECEKTISVTKQNNRERLSREIVTKLGQDLTSKVRADLIAEEQQLLAKKDTLWDKITGKSKVRAAQVENLRLRIRLVESGGLSAPETMDEMMVYAEKYRAVLGEDKLPETIRKIMPSQNKDVVVSDEEREMLEVARTDNYLMPVATSKKQMLAVLEDNNKTLTSRIQSSNSEDKVASMNNLEPMIKNSVERCLDTALFYTADLTEEQKRQYIHDRMTI